MPRPAVGGPRGGAERSGRQLDREPRAGARAGPGGDAPAQRLDDPLRERETEAGPRPAPRRIRPEERARRPAEIVLGAIPSPVSSTAIRHTTRRQLRLRRGSSRRRACGGPRSRAGSAARARPSASTVASPAPFSSDTTRTPCPEPGARPSQRRVDEFAQRRSPVISDDHACVQLRQLEQIVHHRSPAARRTAASPRVATERRRVVDHAVLDRLGHRAERCERRAEIVRDRRDQVAAHPSASRFAFAERRCNRRPSRRASTPTCRARGRRRVGPMRASRSPSPSIRAARSTEWIASPARLATTSAAATPAPDRVDEQHRDQRRIVVVTNICIAKHGDVHDRHRGGDHGHRHEPLPERRRSERRRRRTPRRRSSPRSAGSR